METSNQTINNANISAVERSPNDRSSFYFSSLRAAIGKAISNENPSFVAGDDGGCGSVGPGLLSPRAADFVSAPIATFFTAGGSQVLCCLSSVRSVLIGPMADLRTIKPASFLWDRVRHGKAGAKSFDVLRRVHIRLKRPLRSDRFPKVKAPICREDAQSQPLGIEYLA
jgi:hypothetical protein